MCMVAISSQRQKTPIFSHKETQNVLSNKNWPLRFGLECAYIFGSRLPRWSLQRYCWCPLDLRLIIGIESTLEYVRNVPALECSV